MSEPFPSPTSPVPSRNAVFLGYLDFFRSRIAAKVEGLSDEAATTSRLPTGWTPVQLVRHLTYVERRWLDWGFLGQPVKDPWGDQREGRWYVPAGYPVERVLAELRAQGERSRLIISGTDLTEIGQPGPRWDGAEPATLERVLFHVVQEYARHLGHLDVVAELAGGPVGE